jgi:hypothetical protein
MILRERGRGQTLVEFALVAPLAFFVVAGTLTLGLGLFYQQQVTNAAREAARYASLHSATSQCPTTSWLRPAWSMVGDPNFDQDMYNACDPPHLGWPEMRKHARSLVFGLDPSGVHFSACWSGYMQGTSGYDREPVDPESGDANPWGQCTMPSGAGEVDPRTETGTLPCPPLQTTPGSNSTTPNGSDRASNLAHSNASTTNQVTVYACYEWSPPFYSDFLFGGPVTLRAVITEAMQHQQ